MPQQSWVSAAPAITVAYGNRFNISSAHSRARGGAVRDAGQPLTLSRGRLGCYGGFLLAARVNALCSFRCFLPDLQEETE